MPQTVRLDSAGEDWDGRRVSDFPEGVVNTKTQMEFWKGYNMFHPGRK